MLNSEFIDFVSKICRFYERKMPNPGTLELWFDVIHGINSNELAFILDRIVKDNESYPRNITALMWALHYEKKGGGGDVERKYIACDYCDGEGLLLLRKEVKKDGTYMGFVFRCAHCKQSPYTACPWGNKYVLINKGYEEYPLYPGTENIANPRELQQFINRFSEGKSLNKGEDNEQKHNKDRIRELSLQAEKLREAERGRP